MGKIPKCPVCGNRLTYCGPFGWRCSIQTCCMFDIRGEEALWRVLAVAQNKLVEAMRVLNILEVELRKHNHEGTADLIARDIQTIENIKE